MSNPTQPRTLAAIAREIATDPAYSLTPEEQAKLEVIRVKAKARHERERKAAAKRGRKDYPLLPYECSWAYEEQFRRRKL